MSARLTAIQCRRAELTARAAAQRDELGYLLQPWQKPLAFVDRGVALLRNVRAHPFAIAIGVALLAWTGHGRLSVWTGRLWTGWQLYRSLVGQRPQDRV